jgi:single-strand DNA-binding protein
MTDLNHLVLIGRITKSVADDERAFGYVGQTARATVSIAVNRSKKQADGSWGDEVSYFDINIWGKTAENLKPYLVKGQQICVEAMLKQDRWEKDGQKFSKVTINANNVQLLGSKKDSQNSSPAPQSQPTPSQQSFNPSDGFPEDLPF